MTKEECIALLNRYAEYNGMGIPNLAGCREAMKTAAELLQRPSLPSNLDEAAEESMPEEEGFLEIDIYGGSKAVYSREQMLAMYKAGTELMAGQGFISEGIINQTSGEDTIIELNEHIGYLEDCEEVIVNIRKKQ